MACALAFSTIGGGLSGRADVVGYPLYADFNVNRYFDAFYLFGILAPLAWLAGYALLSAVGPLRRCAPARHADRRGTPFRAGVAAGRVGAGGGGAGRGLSPGGLCARVVTGLTLALEVSVIARPGLGGVVLPVALAGVAFGVGLSILDAVVAGRLGVRPGPLVGCVAALCAVPLLYGVSRQTALVVGPAQVVVHYPFFGRIALGVVLAVALAVLAWRRRGGASPAELEYGLVVLLVVPVAVYCLCATIPGNLGPMDVFGEGEYLGGGWLMLHGYLPWRDLYLIHGVLDDGLKGIVGLQLFGRTRWAGIAGIRLVFFPAYWIGTYLLAAWLFFRRPLALLATVVAFTCGLFVDWDVRYLLWAPTLLLFGLLVERPGRRRAVAFSLVVVLMAILTPEMSYALPVFAVLVVALDCYSAGPGRPRPSDLRLTRWCAAGALGGGGAFFAYLLATGSLSGFIGYFQDFADAHALTGGIPLFTDYAVPPVVDALGVRHFVSVSGGALARYPIELYLPALLAVVTGLVVVASVRGGRRLSVEDWVAMGAAGFVVCYFQKGLARADDSHIGEVFAVTVPLILVLGGRLLLAAEAGLAHLVAHFRARGRHRIVRLSTLLGPGALAGLAAVVVVGLLVPVDPVSLASATPTRFRISADPPPPPFVPGDPSLGYGTNVIPKGVGVSLARAFRTYAGAHGAVFDFSNAPGLVDFLLDRPPATRFYDINLAITPKAQMLLISDLKRTRPRLVLWGSYVGMVTWDFINNEVRHHLVAQYLLEHYRPLLQADHELLLVADDAPPSKVPTPPAVPGNKNLYDTQTACAWGYIPNFLDLDVAPGPGRDADVSPVPAAAAPRAGRVYRLVLPKDAPAYGFVVVRTTARPGPVALAISNVGHASKRDITWVAAAGSAPSEVEAGSCLQWHGFTRTLYLRYDGPGRPTAVSFLPAPRL